MLGPLCNKVASLQACNFIKKRLQHRCFPLKFAKFLRTPFFAEYLWWLLLNILHSGKKSHWVLLNNQNNHLRSHSRLSFSKKKRIEIHEIQTYIDYINFSKYYEIFCARFVIEFAIHCTKIATESCNNCQTFQKQKLSHSVSFLSL